MIDAGVVLMLLAEKQFEVLSLRQEVAALRAELEARPSPPTQPVRMVVPKESA